ncbi:MAG: hypothetical protein AVDCRST_MAG30-941 [uncultured Solirubrobacteraceae bacterium]|uniref:Uncharacterized protein n=1 Tax=uncultured Solirubrobacteraceae bacterium TaxID=1162706 RepID=A0A6J4S2Q5_9ACTN|nr:MAG: hypothetical protein AVDCRST_MAG30-941 [uncultured Solirubrobacteraceae bacterium]
MLARSVERRDDDPGVVGTFDDLAKDRLGGAGICRGKRDDGVDPQVPELIAAAQPAVGQDQRLDLSRPRQAAKVPAGAPPVPPTRRHPPDGFLPAPGCEVEEEVTEDGPSDPGQPAHARDDRLDQSAEQGRRQHEPGSFARDPTWSRSADERLAAEPAEQEGPNRRSHVAVEELGPREVGHPLPALDLHAGPDRQSQPDRVGGHAVLDPRLAVVDVLDERRAFDVVAGRHILSVGVAGPRRGEAADEGAVGVERRDGPVQVDAQTRDVAREVELVTLGSVGAVDVDQCASPDPDVLDRDLRLVGAGGVEDRRVADGLAVARGRQAEGRAPTEAQRVAALLRDVECRVVDRRRGARLGGDCRLDLLHRVDDFALGSESRRREGERAGRDEPQYPSLADHPSASLERVERVGSRGVARVCPGSSCPPWRPIGSQASFAGAG